MTSVQLTIPQCVLLLALNETSGERKGKFLAYALAGAGLAELALLERIKVAEQSHKRFEIISSTPVGEPYLDACLEIIAAKGSGKLAKSYVNAIGRKSGLLKLLFDSLVQRGVLMEREQKVLFFFTRRLYPESDPYAETELKARLEAVITGVEEGDERDHVIIALAYHAGVLKYNFDKQFLKTHKARIKSIVDGETLSARAVADVIKALEAAAAVAATSAATAGAH